MRINSTGHPTSQLLFPSCEGRMEDLSIYIYLHIHIYIYTLSCVREISLQVKFYTGINARARSVRAVFAQTHTHTQISLINIYTYDYGRRLYTLHICVPGTITWAKSSRRGRSSEATCHAVGHRA